MRAFIAVDVTSDLIAKVADLTHELELQEGFRLVAPENMHLTLKFLGEIDEKQVPQLVELLEGIDLAPFQVTLKGVGVFPSERFVRVAWVGGESPEIMELQKEVEEKAAGLGFKREREVYIPHLTLARADRKVDVGGWLAAHKDTVFGSCTIDKITLYKSSLTPSGPVYEVLHEKRLG